MDNKLTDNARLFYEQKLQIELEKVFDVKYHEVLKDIVKIAFKAGAVFGAIDMKMQFEQLNNINNEEYNNSNYKIC